MEKAPTSCNDSLVLVWLREKPPTSLDDSLVLAVAGMVDEKRKKAPMSHNDSLVLAVPDGVKGEATNKS